MRFRTKQECEVSELFGVWIFQVKIEENIIKGSWEKHNEFYIAQMKQRAGSHTEKQG